MFKKRLGLYLKRQTMWVERENLNDLSKWYLAKNNPKSFTNTIK
jgi:hypothetical protein